MEVRTKRLIIFFPMMFMIVAAGFAGFFALEGIIWFCTKYQDVIQAILLIGLALLFLSLLTWLAVSKMVPSSPKVVPPQFGRPTSPSTWTSKSVPKAQCESCNVIDDLQHELEKL